MTTKEQFIVHMRRARSQHLKWLNTIRLMVMGIAVDREEAALNPSESPFGVWLYDEAMAFVTSSSKNVLDEIADLHNRCHEHYIKIYHTLYGSSGGFLRNMFGGSRPGSSELTLAQRYYEELVGDSDALLNRLRLFESQMLAAPEAKFDELVMGAEEPDTAAAKVPTASPKVQRMYRGQPVD